MAALGADGGGRPPPMPDVLAKVSVATRARWYAATPGNRVPGPPRATGGTALSSSCRSARTIPVRLTPSCAEERVTLYSDYALKDRPAGGGIRRSVCEAPG